MHVKEQVREFVHDVKRKFSQRRKRDTTSTLDSYDYSSTDTLSHLDDSSSSSISSGPSISERSRLIKFIRPRSPSSTSKDHHHNVLHKVKRVGNRRYRLFSAPTVPSQPMVESSHKQAVSYQGPESLASFQDMTDTLASLQDYSDVIDISARQSGSVVPEQSSTPSSSRGADRDSLSQFDTASRSDTPGTLVTATSASDHKKSVSESDSRFDSIDLHSDEYLASVVSAAVDPMADVPPPLPPKSDIPRDEEVALVQLSPAPSPAPVYIPRLTAPSMFLPIPNVVPGEVHPFTPICVSPASVCTLAVHLLIRHPLSTISLFEAMMADQSMPPWPPISTDPLSALLTKYVPAEQRPRRDVVGEYAGRDIHEMVMSNSWRALAKMARDRIVASDPEDLGRVLDLWSFRLSALARLRLTNQASAECTNLFAVLNAVPTTSLPGAFPPPSTSFPSSPAPTVSSSLSPLSGVAQLPGTPSQKPSTLVAPTAALQQGVHEHMHPFELTVFHARVHYWSGDPLGYVDALSRILARCKERAREEARVVVQRRELGRVVGGDVESDTRSKRTGGDEDKNEGKEDAENGADSMAQDVEEEGPDEDEDVEERAENDDIQDGGVEKPDDWDKEDAESAENDDEGKEKPDDILVAAEANLSMWLERIARVCLILASQMIEMNDYQAAINLLTPLCTHHVAPTHLPIPELHSALARVYLLSGNLQKAEEHFSIAASAAANSTNETGTIAMNTALLATASGNWTHAEEVLSEMVDKDPGNFAAINNLAVVLLSQGKVKQSIDRLEAALRMSPSSVVVAEPFLFNLSTLYELRSTAAIDKKRGLLTEVAKWSGDGLKTSCLKMPPS